MTELQEGKQVWKCDICGGLGTWNENWASYGAFRDLEDFGREGVVVVCSPACKAKVDEIIAAHGKLSARKIKELIPR